MMSFVLAQLADLATGLSLPAGTEANPLGAALPTFWPLAAAAKVGLITLVIVAAKRNPRLHLFVLGSLVGIAGAASNLRAMA